MTTVDTCRINCLIKPQSTPPIVAHKLAAAAPPEVFLVLSDLSFVITVKGIGQLIASLVAPIFKVDERGRRH